MFLGANSWIKSYLDGEVKKTLRGLFKTPIFSPGFEDFQGLVYNPSILFVAILHYQDFGLVKVAELSGYTVVFIPKDSMKMPDLFSIYFRTK